VVLLAFSDASLLPLLSSEHFENKLWTYLLPASRENFEIALDKSRTLKLAQEVGVEIPITHICTPEDDLAAIAGDMEYPVVVKPRRSVSWNGNTGVQTTAMFAFSADELKQKCSAVFNRTGEFPLIQEFVRGEEASVQFMCEDGRVIGACANRRLRSVWPHGGPGVLKETVPLSYRGLGERARCIARKLQWSGPIMIEFKIDQASGVPKLMEVNGRFWGSLPLAITAGSDFPHQYYRLARGEEVTPTVEYQTGVISRHFLADVKNLLWTLFKRHPLRSFAYPARLRAIKDFLIVPKNCRSDVMDIRDMKPVFAEMFYALSRIRSMWSVGEE
jgi:predicted ATP-grasp superfamily ATP-dependent carboligase